MLAANRRRAERRLCRRVAKIQCGAGSLPRDCTITDVSEIPSHFTLIFERDHARQCRLAWRIGCEFGAEFVD